MSLDAERLVLGAMMYDESERAAWQAADTLVAEDFSRSAHASMFTACQTLMADSTTPDPVSVTGELRKMGVLEQSGGAAYVHGCVDSLPSLANLANYIRQVRQSSTMRRIGRAGKEIAMLGEATHLAEADALGAVTEILLALTDRTGATAVEIGPLLSDAMKLLPIGRRFVELPGLVSLHLTDGSMTIVGARPSVGKTAWAFAAAEAWAGDGIPVRFYSYEMPALDLALRVIARHSGLSVPHIDMGLKGDELAKAENAARSKMGIPLTLASPHGQSIDALASDLRVFAGRGGRVAIIDYLGLATVCEKGESQYQATTRASKLLKSAALATGLVLVVLSQLNRHSVEGGKSRPPTMSELRDSGQVEQDADNIVLLHRYDEDEQDKALGFWRDRGYLTHDPTGDKRPLGTIHVAKVRQGSVGKHPAWWDAKRLTFELVDRQEA